MTMKRSEMYQLVYDCSKQVVVLITILLFATSVFAQSGSDLFDELDGGKADSKSSNKTYKQNTPSKIVKKEPQKQIKTKVPFKIINKAPKIPQNILIIDNHNNIKAPEVVNFEMASPIFRNSTFRYKDNGQWQLGPVKYHIKQDQYADEREYNPFLDGSDGMLDNIYNSQTPLSAIEVAIAFVYNDAFKFCNNPNLYTNKNIIVQPVIEYFQLTRLSKTELKTYGLPNGLFSYEIITSGDIVCYYYTPSNNY